MKGEPFAVVTKDLGLPATLSQYLSDPPIVGNELDQFERVSTFPQLRSGPSVSFSVMIFF
jgi:hypothetical protein